MLKKSGTFYGVGVGPGDPELMTLKAVRVLEGSGVLAVPRSRDSCEDGRSKALAILEGVVDVSGKEILDLQFAMTKDADERQGARMAAADKIVERLSVGTDVSFIPLGDPMTYSTFSYLVPFVEAALPGVPVRSVPGITSFSALASRSLVPLAESGEKLVVIPAAYEMDGVKKALEDFDTVVLMKVNSVFDRLVDLLEREGLVDNALAATRVGWPGEEITSDLKSLQGTKLDYFTTLIIKKRPIHMGGFRNDG